MKLRITELRKIIRDTILESYEAEEEVYDDTVMPGEEADKELIAEPDLTDQDERDEYISRKQATKKKKSELRSGQETEESLGDEASMVGGPGGIGGSIRGHVGGAWGKREKPKKLKPKNAMSISKALDEYDE